MFMKIDETETIGIIGLGYVGLPLACLFAHRYQVVGFDLNAERVAAISQGSDITDEVGSDELREALDNGLICTTDSEQLRQCTCYIVAVPTPTGIDHEPILTPLKDASRTVGSVLKPGDVVVYESTVWPGMTEEVCAPIIEQVSGLKLNRDFSLGYSPERINPGDKQHKVATILKITSGSTPEAAERIDGIYNSVLKNGTFRAASIRVAEAAKILENTQRDVNVAVMNEASVIFDAMGIDIFEVLAAAGTKWNFLPFKPGLVGGHCIGVDPYYLIEKAKEHGVVPHLFIEARRVNEEMGPYVAERVAKRLQQSGHEMSESSILVLGFTFKENCPDVRNTKVADVYHVLHGYTPRVEVFDPWASPEQVRREYGIGILSSADSLAGKHYDAVVQLVEHDCFNMLDIKALLSPGGVYCDIKKARSLAAEMLGE
jgi:UDP-N-acetyl-D-galactosamine dehydrogenase